MIRLVHASKQPNFHRKLQHESSKSSAPRPSFPQHNICTYSYPCLCLCPHDMFRPSPTAHMTDHHDAEILVSSSPETLWAGSSVSPSGKKKTLNLFTPKFHFLEDYVLTIQMFECMDSFSTQVVCI
jgi:hypothetical protein